MTELQPVISEENSEFGKRVDIISQETGLNLSEIAERIGFSATAITNARNGKKPFGKKVAVAIEEKLGFNVEWTLFGRGSKYKSKTGDIKGANLPGAVYVGELPGVLVPYISIRERLGFNYNEFHDKVNSKTHEMIRVFTVPGNKSAVVVEVDGDDLGQILIPSTKVLAIEVKPEDWEMQSSGLYAIATDNQLILKRIFENRLKEADTLILVSDEQTGRGRIAVDRRSIRGIWKGAEIVGRPID